MLVSKLINITLVIIFSQKVFEIIEMIFSTLLTVTEDITSLRNIFQSREAFFGQNIFKMIFTIMCQKDSLWIRKTLILRNENVPEAAVSKDGHSIINVSIQTSRPYRMWYKVNFQLSLPILKSKSSFS